MGLCSDFTIVNGVLTEYLGSGGDVVIPEGVTAIKSDAFQRCKSRWNWGREKIEPVPLKSVVIPEGVTILKDGTFHDCRVLERVTLPESLIEICGARYGDGCFRGCYDLKDVNFPGRLEKIGENAFSFTDISKVVLPSSVTQIGRGAFSNCKELTEIILPLGLESIEESLFKDCSKLSYIVVPQGVRSIEEDAFRGCRNLSNVQLPESLKFIGATAFCGCEQLDNISLPTSLREIADGAEDKYGFREWVGAFSHTALKNVVLPDNLKKIGSYAFSHCAELQTVALPKKLERIQRHAFEECINLQELILPASIQSFAESPLYKCENLRKLKIWFKENRKESTKFLAYAEKIDSSNLDGYGKPGFWEKYDLELINNGPNFKYKLPMRLLGMVGRLMDPIGLSDENRSQMVEYLTTNAKKLIALAEELGEPDIIPVMFANGVINRNNEKLIRKLLSISAHDEIARHATEELKISEPIRPEIKKAPLLSEKKKVELLENAVMNNDLEAARKTLEEHQPEFTARALGLASRFSGAEMVLALLNGGASFQYTATPVMKRNFHCMISISTHTEIQKDYSCYLLREYEVKSYSNEIIRDEQRAEVLKVLISRRAVDLQILLYYAILLHDWFIADLILKRGTTLSKYRADIVSGVPVFSSVDHFYQREFIDAFHQADDLELFSMLSRFMSCIKVDKIHLPSNLLYPSGPGYHANTSKNAVARLCSPVLFDFFLHKTDLAKVIKKWEILYALIDQNNAEGLDYVLEEKWVNSLTDLELLMKEAQTRNPVHPGIIAVILKYKKQLSGEKQDTEEAFSLDENITAADLRKIWGTKKQENGDLTIISYKGNDENVIVPEKIGKSDVKAISSGAFRADTATSEPRKRARESITSVVLPGTIREIPEKLFEVPISWRGPVQKDHLQRIVLNEGIVRIGSRAFQNRRSLCEVILPNSLEEIGSYAFGFCSALKEIHLPDGIKVLPNGVFSNSGLESITVPESVETIEENAFRDCKNLKNVSLPSSVKLGKNAFSGCDMLADPQGRIVVSGMLF